MDIKELVESIIADITNCDVSISDLLRKTQVLAFKLNNDSLKQWLNCEVNGYESDAQLPKYRKPSAVLFGQIEQNRGFSGSVLYPHFRLPIDHLPDNIQSLIQSWDCRYPINEIQHILDSSKSDGNVQVTCSNKVIPLVSNALESNIFVNQVWLEVPLHDLANIVDSVKNKLLDVMLGLDAQLELGVDFNLPQNQQKVNNVVNNITAGVANFGDNSTIEIANTSIAVNSGHIADEQLLSQLNDIVNNISKLNSNHEIVELLNEIKAELSKEKRPKKLKLFFNAILGISTGVATNLITPYAQEAISLLSSLV